jgi:hypothetical protein
MTEEMRAAALETMQQNIGKSGPGAIHDVEQMLASRFNFKSERVHYVLSFSFYEGFRTVFEVKEGGLGPLKEETKVTTSAPRIIVLSDHARITKIFHQYTRWDLRQGDSFYGLTTFDNGLVNNKDTNDAPLYVLEGGLIEYTNKYGKWSMHMFLNSGKLKVNIEKFND